MPAPNPTHCAHNHLLAGSNMRLDRDGRVRCKACASARGWANSRRRRGRDTEPWELRERADMIFERLMYEERD